MENTENNHANKVLIVILIILICAIVLGIALFVWTARKNRSAAQSAAQASAPQQTSAQSAAHAPATSAQSATHAPAVPAASVPAHSTPASSAAHAPAAPAQSATHAPAMIALSPGLEIPLCPGTRASSAGASSQTAASDHQVRKFTSYTLCYRESYEEAEWAAWELDKSELTRASSRTDDFRPDPLITTGSASLDDYRSSGYDRGHLAPAADFSFSPAAMSESFYLSNMTPQAPSFNRGIWKELEEQVRSWSENFGRVYVVCGPVLDSPASSFASIGADKVAIPRYFYKVILAPVYRDTQDASTPDDAAKVIAVGFIIPNKGCSDSYWNYAVTVDAVEARTGLDFYSLLENTAENKTESSFARSDW